MTDAPLATRVRAAHLLAGLLWLQGLAGLAGAVVAYFEGLTGSIVVFGIMAAFGAVAGALEWGRHVRAELVAFLSFVYGVVASIYALPLGLWYFVPFLGVATLAVMLALLYRIAVRSESRHHARHGFA